MFKSFFNRYFFPQKPVLPAKIQSFTYYVPSPPVRASGYREKQFDKVFGSFINLGFRVKSFQMIPNPHPNHSGFWVLFLLECLTTEAETLDLNQFCLDESLGLEVTADQHLINLEIENDDK